MRLLFIFAALPLFASYVGNPASPALMDAGFFSLSYPIFKGTSGYVADYTSNKRYTSHDESGSFNPNDAFRKFGLHSQLASFSLIFLERLEIFGTAGSTKEQVKAQHLPPSEPFAYDFQSHHHLSWSVGGKVILIQWGRAYLGFNATYFAIPESPKSFFKFFEKMRLPFDMTHQSFSLREWQCNLGLACRIAFLTPYVGVTWLKSRLHVTSGPETAPVTYHNSHPFGYVFGLTLSMTGRFHVTAERRITDEFGYTFSTVAVF
ncbi:MAG: major outer membrane protein [Chlamydiota bacterium]